MFYWPIAVRQKVIHRARLWALSAQFGSVQFRTDANAGSLLRLTFRFYSSRASMCALRVHMCALSRCRCLRLVRALTARCSPHLPIEDNAEWVSFMFVICEYSFICCQSGRNCTGERLRKAAASSNWRKFRMKQPKIIIPRILKPSKSVAHTNIHKREKTVNIFKRWRKQQTKQKTQIIKQQFAH